MMKSTQKSSLYWKKQAKQFTSLYRLAPFGSPRWFVQRFLSNRTGKLLAYTPVSSHTVMADVGCGSGEHMKYFIPKCRYVYGLDYSRQMLRQARKELALFPGKKYQLILADAHRIPLKNHCVDVAIAMGLLDYVNSPATVVKECARVLKPGGILVVSMPKQPSLFSFFRTPLGIIVRKHIFRLPPIQNTATRDGVCQLLSDQGFTVKHCTSCWGAMWIVKAQKKS